MSSSVIPLQDRQVAFTAMNMPWVESPFFETLLRERNLSADEQQLARKYHRDGYVVLDDIVPAKLAARIKQDAENLYTDAQDGPRSRYRVQDGWRDSKAIGDLASLPRVLDTLRMLYGRNAIPFQTLNFRHGSQQAGHSDQIHFSCIPARYMCGVWVALEDVNDDNGPLFYYPGSQRLAEYNLYDIGASVEHADYAQYERFIASLMNQLGYKPERLHVKAGQALIWSSNLVHGGTEIRKAGATRHSQVNHYYFEDCIYYTPVFSNVVTGEYFWRDDVIDIRTGQRVEQTYNGKKFHAVSADGPRKRIVFGDKPTPEEAASLRTETRRLLSSYRDRLGRAVTTPYRHAKSTMTKSATWALHKLNQR